MPTLRAIAANFVLYLNTLLWGLVCIPALIGPQHWITKAVRGWAMSSMVLIRLTAGIRWEIRGLENLPTTDGKMSGCLIAAKHQSAWETFGLLPYLDDPAYILKEELMRIPIYGWYARRAKMIPIKRVGRAKALRSMGQAAKQAVDENRQIIIFPEGTRRAVGAEPDYKVGVFHLYKTLDVPLIPVALNSGLFWPRRQFQRHPGTLVVSILPPVEPGLSTQEAREKLQSLIETETDRLVAAGR